MRKRRIEREKRETQREATRRTRERGREREGERERIRERERERERKHVGLQGSQGLCLLPNAKTVDERSLEKLIQRFLPRPPPLWLRVGELIHCQAQTRPT